MAVAAVCNQTLSLCNGLVKGLAFIHSQNWGQLLVRKLFYRYLQTLPHRSGSWYPPEPQRLPSLRSCSALTNDLRIQGAIDEDGLTNLSQSHPVLRNSSLCIQILSLLPYKPVQNGYRLLRCTDHTIIKGLGMDDGVDCHLDICGIINDSRVFPAPTPSAGLPEE